MNLQVAINAMPLRSDLTGVGYYVANLLKAFRRRDDLTVHAWMGSGWQLLGNVENERSRDSSLHAWLKQARRFVPVPRPVVSYVQRRRFTRALRQQQVNLYHEPNYIPLSFDLPVVMTVHDLSVFRYPETHPKERVKHIVNHLPKAIYRAAMVITDSVFIQQEIVQQFGIDQTKVIPIHLGVSPMFIPQSEEASAVVLARYNLKPKTYLLSVATLEPRKNIANILRSYTMLPSPIKQRYSLALVGMETWYAKDLSREIEKLSSRENICWLGYLPDTELPAIYSGAKMLLYPSLYEGFGLPPLEAMACGTPVIVSNRASLPEVVKDDGIFVEPNDLAALARAIQELLEDDSKAQALSERGKRRAARFTWERCAAETIAVYQKVAQI